MKKIIYLTIGIIAAAVLSIGLSFIGTFNLVWVVVLVLMLADMETTAVIFAVLSGFLMDVLLHSNIGSTSLIILVGLVFYVLAKAARFGGKLYEKVILVVIVLSVAFIGDYFIKGGGGSSGVSEIGTDFLLPKVAGHAVAVFVGYGIYTYISAGRARKSPVTLK